MPEGHIIPNNGLHTAWGPSSPAIPDDVEKACRYLVNTAWLRCLDGSTNILFVASPFASSSTSDPCSSRCAAEMGILEATEQQYTAMLQRFHSATPSNVVTSLSEAFRRALAGTYTTQLGHDEDALILQISFTVRGVAGWLAVQDVAAATSFIVSAVTAVTEVCGPDVSNGVAAVLKDVTVFGSSFAEGIAANAGAVCSSSATPPAKNAAVCVTTALRGDAVISAALAQQQAVFISAGVLLASTYFAPLMKVYSSFFVRWVSGVAKMGGGTSSFNAVATVAVKAVLKLAQRSVAQSPSPSSSPSRLAACVGLMLASLVDGGSLQASGTSAAAATEKEGTCREAFVVVTARAALEAFTEAIFVAGPLQWASVTASTNSSSDKKSKDALVNGHPLVTGNRTVGSSSPASTSSSSVDLKRRRGESGKVAESAPMTATSSWDIVVRDVFPLFMSQTGFEFPWHGIETMLRDAVAPSTIDKGVSAEWGPTSSTRIDRRKAAAIVDDTFAIIAKEVCETTFPARIAALTRKVPNSATNGVCLKTICSSLEGYHKQCTAAAKAHAGLFAAIAKKQRQRVSSSSSSGYGRAAAVAAAAALAAAKEKGLDDIESTVKEGFVSLASAPSVFATPAAYANPLLFTVLSLVGISHTVPTASSVASFVAGGNGASAPSILPTVIDVEDLVDMVKIKCDLLPSIIELKASCTSGANVYATPQLVATVRARVVVDVLMLAMVRLSQLASRDQTDYWLFGRGLFAAVRAVAVDASASVGASGDVVQQVLGSLRTPLPPIGFNFGRFMVDNSEGAQRWTGESLQFCQGYTPLSALMESLFGEAVTAQQQQQQQSLVSTTALSLEAFADAILLRIASAELSEGRSSAVASGSAALKPMCSLAVDAVAWCLLYSRATGATVDATGFLGNFPFGVQSAMKGATNASAAASPYTAISAWLNPAVIDHPTRGYAMRRVLDAAAEALAKAVVAGQSASSPSSAASKHAMLEARMFVGALEVFGLLDWSYFGANFKTQFAVLLKA